jgi:hypothetical protein
MAGFDYKHLLKSDGLTLDEAKVNQEIAVREKGKVEANIGQITDVMNRAYALFGKLPMHLVHELIVRQRG